MGVVSIAASHMKTFYLGNKIFGHNYISTTTTNYPSYTIRGNNASVATSMYQTGASYTQLEKV